MRAVQEPSVVGLVLHTNSSSWEVLSGTGIPGDGILLLMSLRELQGVPGGADCCRAELGLCHSSS